MRHPARPLVSTVISAIAAVLLIVSGAGAAHAALTPLSPQQLRTVTDEYLFDYSLSSFSSTRDQRPYSDQLDWSSDGCTWSPDRPLGYDFTATCHRHDFGYHNYRIQFRFTEENRLILDDQFRDDMYGVCGSRPLCRGVANIYYGAVRQFGSSSTSTAQALDRANVDERVETYIETYLTAHATR